MNAAIRRIVVLGKTGAGKSSLVNTIVGQPVFEIDNSPKSGTINCQAKTRSVKGKKTTLIDTPGFFDTDRSEEELKPEIVRCITECAPGPHALLIVLKVEKYTEHEKAVVRKIHQYFSVEAFKYATVLFTHGDQLPEKITIEDYVRQSKDLSHLVETCGGRCHVIDNVYWNKQHPYRSNEFQVEELLKTIDRMTEANKEGFYTNEMLQACEKKIQEEESKLSSAGMSKEATRQKAKLMFAVDVLKVARPGFTSGALLGLFLGGKVWDNNERIALGLGVAMGAPRGAEALLQSESEPKSEID